MAAQSTIYYTKDAGGSKGDGVAVTGTGIYYSYAFEIPDAGPVSLHIEWTETAASLTGTLSLWYTNKLGANTANDNDWVQDTSFPAPTVGPSGNGKAFISIADTAAMGVRLKYVNATGSGTLKCWVAAARVV